MSEFHILGLAEKLLLLLFYNSYHCLLYLSNRILLFLDIFLITICYTLELEQRLDNFSIVIFDFLDYLKFQNLQQFNFNSIMP